jgi:GAF domain-containing protein
MLRESELIGAFTLFRQEVRPFTDKQIALVRSFAAQAVIAIENARLLNELRQRTDDLSESLEQQTATSEVLQVISSSASDLRPVFASMVENAIRLCSANFGALTLLEGDAYRIGAMHNMPPGFAERWQGLIIRPGPLAPLVRAATSKDYVHIGDLSQDAAYIERDPNIVALVDGGHVRTILVVPMLKEQKFVGALSIYRQEKRPFTTKQIELIKNFAAAATEDWASGSLSARPNRTPIRRTRSSCCAPAVNGNATVFREELRKLGWTEGRNIEITPRAPGRIVSSSRHRPWPSVNPT